MRSKIILIGVATLTAIQASSLSAAMRCDSKQSMCIVESRRLIVGDSIVFRNSDDEVVARGEVSDMDGNNRTITVSQRYGDIDVDNRVERVESINFQDGTTKVYKRPSTYAMGLSLGLMPMDVASDATAYDAEVFGQYRLQGPWIVSARGQFFNASGIIDTGEQQTDNGRYTVSGFGILGGVGYKLFEKKVVAMRLLAELGSVYVSTTTTAQNYPSSIDKAGNGIGYVARAGADVMLTSWGKYQPMASAAYSILNRATATTLSAGIFVSL